MASNAPVQMELSHFWEKIEAKPWKDTARALDSLGFAEERHQGQFRKQSKVPYFIHPLRVAINVMDEPDCDMDLVIAALLHDTLEDTRTTPAEIGSRFGSKVLTLVEGMTKPDSETKKKLGAAAFYKHYFEKLKAGAKKDPRVLKLKLADRTDNLATYARISRKEKIDNYIWETKQYLTICEEEGVQSLLIQQIKDQLSAMGSSL